MLASNLSLIDVIRLWDTYFSSDEGFELHIYVCLAILITHTEELLELEYSELIHFLKYLPNMDMDQVRKWDRGEKHVYMIHHVVICQSC